jgi:orotidine-5'-phosphate decarboxylase
MDYKELYSNIIKKRSFLCIGLDTNPALIPVLLKEREYPLFEFNKSIIDATYNLAVAYKPNVAFYEAEGSAGWRELEMTIEYIREKDPSLFIIADAKRGDIGNTAERYAHAFFERMDCDAVTVAPYMGRDSVDPFLKHKGKWAVVLALTSNPSAEDFETQGVVTNVRGNEPFVNPLYNMVIEKAMEWGSIDNTMFVVGATRPQKLAEIRETSPEHFFLVPGVGAQGGSLAEVARYGMNDHCGLLVNISRDILFAWKKEGSPFDQSEFDKAAAVAAGSIAGQMALLL